MVHLAEIVFAPSLSDRLKLLVPGTSETSESISILNELPSATDAAALPVCPLVRLVRVKVSGMAGLISVPRIFLITMARLSGMYGGIW